MRPAPPNIAPNINSKEDSDDSNILSGISKQFVVLGEPNQNPAKIIIASPASSINVNVVFIHTDCTIPQKFTNDKAATRTTATNMGLNCGKKAEVRYPENPSATVAAEATATNIIKHPTTKAIK